MFEVWVIALEAVLFPKLVEKAVPFTEKFQEYKPDFLVEWKVFYIYF